MPAYSVYGLTVASNLALSGLPDAPASATPEITLALGEVPPWRRSSPRDATVRYRTPPSEALPDDNLLVYEFPEGFLFRYADETEFHVSHDGRAIWATWPVSSSLPGTETYLLGPVLGFAQRLRGVFCLHASAVVVDELAIALCGPAESGKSTTAGAFAALGHAVLADDLTAIHLDGTDPVAMPAYDHLRVWEQAERILLGSSGALPRLAPGWDKRALRLQGQGWSFRETPARLGAIVLLEPREDGPAAPRVTPVSAADAFVAMAAGSYANYLLDDRMRRAEFAGIARFIPGVKVFRATAHADPARLGAFVRVIAAATAA